MSSTTSKTGNVQKQHNQIVKRYCQTLDLVDDPHLIKKYISAHTEENHWKEVVKGLREIGILEMEIYVYSNRLFMIVETGLDFDWEIAFSKLESLPRQAEWETKMSFFQRTKGEKSSEKWLMMDRIFRLYDSEPL